MEPERWGYDVQKECRFVNSDHGRSLDPWCDEHSRSAIVCMRELRREMEWQAACTRALLESQARLAEELKQTKAVALPLVEAAQALIRQADDPYTANLLEQVEGVRAALKPFEGD